MAIDISTTSFGYTAITSTTGAANVAISSIESDTWSTGPVYYKISIMPSTTYAYTTSTTDIVTTQPMTAPNSNIFYINYNTGYGAFDADVKRMRDHIKRAAVPVGCQLSFDF